MRNSHNSAIARRVGMAAVIACMASAAGAADAPDYELRGSQPVYRCDRTGFIELPGTETCLKVGGHARLVTIVTTKNWFGLQSYLVRGIMPDGSKTSDTFEMYGQARLNFDARTVTEYGTLRAFIELQATDLDSRTGGPLSLRHAFIQFGNWTFGKTWSTFLNLASAPQITDAIGAFTGDNSIRRNQIRYTQSFGNGLSIAVAIEDQNYTAPTGTLVTSGPFVPLAPPGAVMSADNDRNEFPDLVATLRLETDVGEFQVSGALHRNEFKNIATVGGVAVPAYTDSSTGFALLAAFASAPTERGLRTFRIKAMYTDGASQYLQDQPGIRTNVVWGRCGIVNCILDNVRKGSLMAAVALPLGPEIHTNFGAGIARTDYGTLGTALVGPAAVPGVFKVDTAELFANLVWSPAPRLEFMWDNHVGFIDYNGADQNPNILGVQDSDSAFLTAFDVTKKF